MRLLVWQTKHVSRKKVAKGFEKWTWRGHETSDSEFGTHNELDTVRTRTFTVFVILCCKPQALAPRIFIRNNVTAIISFYFARVSENYYFYYPIYSRKQLSTFTILHFLFFRHCKMTKSFYTQKVTCHILYNIQIILELAQSFWVLLDDTIHTLTVPFSFSQWCSSF